MKVTALGEFGLIAALAHVSKRTPSKLVVGIGDDAAVWKTARGAEVATADILLEGIHFTLASTSWYDLGWKAIAVNLSDLAAMGARPRYVLVSIALPQSVDVEQVEALYMGATAIGDRFETAIVGGDTVRSNCDVVVSVAAIGDAVVRGGQPHLLRRSAATEGDLVAVTGTLGGAAGGLASLAGPHATRLRAAAHLHERLVKPQPRVAEAQVLLASGVKAAIDISDGLVGDLAKMCQASSRAAVIEVDCVPIDPALRQVFPDRALELALHGGEDYELLFAGDGDAIAKADKRLRRRGLAGATVIGRIVPGTPGSVLLRDEAGHLIAPRATGYDAFARG